MAYTSMLFYQVRENTVLPYIVACLLNFPPTCIYPGGNNIKRIAGIWVGEPDGQL
jgi:hypothetical protein